MKDLTNGNEFRTLFCFSLPILVGNLFQQLYNVADSIIVGRVLGRENLAAVGFCFQITLILVALSMGLTMGTSILISKYFGAREELKLRSVIDTGFIFSAGLSVLITLAGIILSDDMIRLFRVPEDTAAFAYTYLRIIFMGAVPSFLYNTITNILRGLGDSKSPVYFLIGACFLNIFLDLLFVKYMHMGIGGAAFATVLSQFFSFLGSFVYMHLYYPQYRIRVRRPDFQIPVLKDTLRIGVPSMAQQLFRSIGFMTLQGMVNGFGSACMAAYAVVTKIDSFALLPALNMGQALANFTAQNRGAGKEERAKRGFRAALIMGWSITFIITLLVLALGGRIIGLFTTDKEVIAIGMVYLWIVGGFYIVETTMQMLNGILLGYEKPFVPLISTIASLCLMQVPTAFLLSQTALDYVGIWIAAPVGWIGGVLIRMIYYKKIVQGAQKNIK